jgi:hypothetical protein
VRASTLPKSRWARPKLLERMSVISQVWHVLITALDSEDWRRRAWAADKILSSYIARDSPFAPARRGRANVDESHTVTFRGAGKDGDLATDELDRDGRTLAVPRYGGEVVTPSLALTTPSPPPKLPQWPGPHPPPPLVAGRYAPWAPPPRPGAVR